MITDAFDKSEVLFGPKDFYGEKRIYVIIGTNRKGTWRVK